MDDINRSWVRVCALDKVPTDRALDLNINGQRLVITRYGEEAHIFQGFCSHMLFPLAGSRVDGCALTCNLHRSKFDVRDGSVLEWSTFPPLVGKALAAVRQQKILRKYETRITDNEVYILWPTDNAASVRVRI